MVPLSPDTRRHKHEHTLFAIIHLATCTIQACTRLDRACSKGNIALYLCSFGCFIAIYTGSCLPHVYSQPTICPGHLHLSPVTSHPTTCPGPVPLSPVISHAIRVIHSCKTSINIRSEHAAHTGFSATHRMCVRTRCSNRGGRVSINS